MKRLLYLTLWLALSVPAFAAPPAGIQATYEVFMSGIKVGRVDESYSRNGDHYTLASVTTPLGLLAMFKPDKIYLTSRGLITGQGLRPLNFEDRREGNPDKSSQANFDWPARKLTLTRKALHTPFTLPDDTQDRLSAMYQFMYLGMKDIETLDFHMTNGNKLDHYHYAIGAREKLDTPAGQFDSIYLDSQSKAWESRTEIWLSAEHKLPCKMLITEGNGDQYTQILSDLKITP